MYIIEKRSATQYIQIYDYGKLYSPPLLERSSAGCAFPRRKLDRVDLISNIYHLLRVHKMRQAWNRRSQKGCSAKVHKALKSAIFSCFEHRISESRLYPVGELFYELYACTGGSLALFSILFENAIPDAILYPSKKKDDMYDAFQYYLHHVGCIQTGFNSKVVDLINTQIETEPGMFIVLPLTAAVQKRDPVLILSLLKFGADPLLCVSSSDVQSHYTPAKHLIDDLNGFYMFKNSGFNENTRAKLAEQEARAWTCLDYIRRAVPTLPLTSSTHITTCQEDENEDESIWEEEDKERVISLPMYSIHPRLAEQINMDFFQLASLKHLCRCTIRRQLKSNVGKVPNVPKGIKYLPLPQMLKSYLNLDIQ